MPLPLVFIGIAAVTGATGVGATVKAGVDQSHAKSINDDSNTKITFAANRLEDQRQKCGEALQRLGEEKVFVLNNSINEFLNYYMGADSVEGSASCDIGRIRLWQSIRLLQQTIDLERNTMSMSLQSLKR